VLLVLVVGFVMTFVMTLSTLLFKTLFIVDHLDDLL
jgi:hypothetical protein